MPHLPLPGADSDQWGDLLNEFLRVSHHEDGKLKDSVQCVETIAALKSLAPVSPLCALVEGYDTPGDGGGGLFRWVSGDGATDDGGLILQPTAGGSGRWHRVFDAPHYNVKWFGAKGDNAPHDTAAIQAALDASLANKNTPVLFPAGTYIVTSPLVVKGGTMLLGCGSQGSAPQAGTTLIVNHDSHGVLFDPTDGIDGVGTGGGIRNFLILKGPTYSGGDAVKVIDISNLRRPGEMVFENLLVYGQGTGVWARGLHINGTFHDVEGNRGVRSILLNKVRMADVCTPNESFKFNQVTHVYGQGIQCDTAHGAPAGISLYGHNANVFLNVLCGGTFLIDSAATVDVLGLSGLTNSLIVDSTKVIGTADVVITNLISNKSENLRVVSNWSGSILNATKIAEATDQTGDGTSYAISFEIVEHDFGFETSIPNSDFVVRCAGTYEVMAQIDFRGIEAAHTRSDSYIGHYATDGSVKVTYAFPTNPYATAVPPSQHCVALRAILKCAYGDIIRCVAKVSGGAKVVDIYGAAGTTKHTFMHIKRIP